MQGMPPEECFDNSVGRCTRGDQCKYVHSNVGLLSEDPLLPEEDADALLDAQLNGAAAEMGQLSGAQALGLEPPVLEKCLDFQNGRCQRGGQCKFVHPQTCYDFSVGKCGRGANCKYMHQSIPIQPGERERSRSPMRTQSMILQNATQFGSGLGVGVGAPRSGGMFMANQPMYQQNVLGSGIMPMTRQPEVCLDFTRGKCERANGCKFLHPETCHDFASGNCTRGDNCKYLHPGPDNNYKKNRGPVVVMNSVPTATNSLLMNHNLASTVLPPTFGALNGAVMTTRESCNDFKAGKCFRGDACKYLHVGQHPLAGQPTLQQTGLMQGSTIIGAIQPMAQARLGMQQTLTSFSPMLPMTVPQQQCLDFKANKCHRGMECKYRHIPVDAPIMGMGMGMGAFTPLAVKNDATTPCYDFRAGKCVRGEGCKYSHLDGLDGTPITVEKCLDFQSNKCHRGDSCRYSHEILA